MHGANCGGNYPYEKGDAPVHFAIDECDDASDEKTKVVTVLYASVEK